VEITERSLRTLVAAVDEQHREGMRTLPTEIRALHSETRGLRPRRAAADDAAIAAFAQSVELAATTAYAAAAKSGIIKTKAILDAAIAFSGHHAQHADAFGAAAGAAASGKANQKLLDALTPSLKAATTELAIVKFAYDLEQAAAATYLYALGALTSQAALQLTASILPVEAQHAVVLGQVLGTALPKGADEFLPPFQNDTGFIDPAKYPIA
jgi:rubrerythrin